MNRDRFLKGKCDPFRAANIAGRMPFFVYYKVIKQSDINPTRDADKKKRGLAQLVDDDNEEEEKMMLEFNNSFTKNKTCYDPSLLVGVEQSPLLNARRGVSEDENEASEDEEERDDLSF